MRVYVLWTTGISDPVEWVVLLHRVLVNLKYTQFYLWLNQWVRIQQRLFFYPYFIPSAIAFLTNSFSFFFLHIFYILCCFKH